MRYLTQTRRAWLRATVVMSAVLAVVVFASQARAQDVITRGSALGGAPVVNLQDVMNDADAYLDRVVTVEGSVTKVCQMMGCWMELVAGDDATSGVRVTFKDYAFFVPKDSQGQLARLEGTFESNLFSKEDADHLIAEGVDLERNADGTASELSFVAAGVELRASR